MPGYELDVPEGVPEPITVTCTDHGVVDRFDASRRRIAFHCEECERELEITLHDRSDWRELTERC